MLYSFILALKRSVRTVYVPVLLAVMAIGLFFAPMLGHEEGMPLAGVCDLDKSEHSERVCDYLLQNEFEMCDDEALLREKISKGEYNCGFIIQAGFSERTEAVDLSEAVIMIDSPLSYQVDLYKNHVGAAVFDEVAPYMSSVYLEEIGISTERMLEQYRERSEKGANFSFVLETAKSVEIVDDEHSRTYVLGAASLLIFAFMMYAACDVLGGDIAVLSHRIGMKKTVLYTVVPDMSIRVIGVWLAVLLAAIASKLINGDDVLLSLTVAMMVYAVIAAAFGIILAAVLANAGRIQIFTFFMLVMGLVLCPIYVDLSMEASLGWLEAFRYILPPYWLWICADRPYMIAIAVAVVPLSLGAIYLRFVNKPKK